MVLTLEAVKDFLRVDGSAEDALLTTLLLASDSYLQGAIDHYKERLAEAEGQQGDTWAEKAKLARLLLIADWYENRTPTERPTSAAVSLLITQLQLEAGVWANGEIHGD